MVIDVNTASREALIAVVGIGEELADAIMRSRPFESIDNLLSVSGIGRISLEHLKAQGLAVVRASDSYQEAHQLSEGLMGREEAIADEQIYVEAPTGASATPQEVEGFNQEGIAEYQRVYRPKTQKLDQRKKR